MVISKSPKRTRDPGRPVSDNYRRLAEYISNDNKEPEEKQAETFDLDDYKRLADYMAADGKAEADSRISERADKLHSLWIENCEAGDSLEFLDMAIAEIEATQDQNTRAKSGKTYHQMTSFRTEDGIPSEEVLRDMVQEYARALGYEDHQRIVACHQDTDNFHFHVAYNKIHPETYLCHSPSWDYYERDKVDRAMEAKHGLSVDNGVKRGKERDETFDLDDYKRLADYMAADGKTEADSRITDRAEKLHSLWIDNCEVGDSLEFLDMAIAEIEATQDQNTRAKSGKTYHQMTSFRTEDGIPSEEVLRDMVQEYAQALGYEDHQRIVACHQDTDNFHFHVAYNKIHPETYLCHSPSWDYYERDKVDRAMEEKHGLSVDNGVKKGNEQDEEHEKTPTGAADMKAHRWEEPFIDYVRRHKEELKEVISQAKGWQDVHEGFAEYDLELKKHANGLVIASRTNKKHQIKASDIDRGFSKPSLEKRFGAFQTPNDGNKKKAREKYGPRPTTKHKGQERLWKAYRANRKSWHKGWKDFLYQMAMIQDPLAIAIIQGQKMILRSLLPFDVSPPPPRPAGRKLRERKPEYPRTYFPDIRSSEAKEAKRRGARWDKEKKQWYAGSKEALLSLTVMKSPLVQERIREERNRKRLEERVYLDVPFEGKDKAKKAGARWDKEKKSWYAPKRDTAKKIVSSSSAVKSEHQKQRELGKFASSLQHQSLLTTSLTRSQVNENIRSFVRKHLTREPDKDTGLEL